MFKATTAVALSVCGLLGTDALAQGATPNPTQGTPTTQVSSQGVPIFRVTVVGRTTSAINYRHRRGATTIDFEGTPLLPKSNGEAKVESKQGYIEIEVEFDDLVPATKFGPEYLTYVLWAITPEGRATNLGEILLNGSRSKLNVTTELQAFGLIVTAEPYFAVTQPSDVVVMENIVRGSTRGTVETVEAKYELLQRGAYLMTSDPKLLPTHRLDKKIPLELYEARNAVHFARVSGADEYATETYNKARALLGRAEDAHEKDRDRRALISVAREAAQSAEDARLIALQRREAESIARDRRRSQEQEAAARAAEAAAVRRAELEREERARAEADRRRAESEAERHRLALETERAQLDRRRVEAEAAVEAAQRARTEAEQAAARLADERRAADARAEQFANERAAADARVKQLAAERADAEARAAQAREQAAQADRERAELRERLQEQLNIILETRESARGLIVNMSDVLFDTASANLKPGAREKLARVAGVLLTYPGLQIEVEGHTDSVGSDEYNQDLSDRRAMSVRNYLVSQGISRQTIDAMGFGESRPVVANTTAAGRQQNRRVELVISGESIAVQTERRDRQQ